MTGLRSVIRSGLHAHVMNGSKRFFDGFANPFAPTWSPFEGLDTNGIDDWAALVWPSRNIGDETQTIAQVGLYPKNTHLIPVNREAMGSYSGQRVAGLMNGWFLHEPTSWPPSPSIVASYVAFHTTPSWEIDSAAQAYLKAHELRGRSRPPMRRLRR